MWGFVTSLSIKKTFTKGKLSKYFFSEITLLDFWMASEVKKNVN